MCTKAEGGEAMVLYNDIAWQKEKSSGMIYVYKSVGEEYFFFDGIGAYIWEQGIKGIDIEEIAEDISHDYPDVTLSEIENDIRNFINELEVNQIIKSVD